MIMNLTGASGAIPRDDWDRMDAHAKQYYEEVRNRKSDIENIARNTEFTEKEIEQVKNYIFIEEHNLGKNYLFVLLPTMTWLFLGRGLKAGTMFERWILL